MATTPAASLLPDMEASTASTSITTFCGSVVDATPKAKLPVVVVKKKAKGVWKATARSGLPKRRSHIATSVPVSTPSHDADDVFDSHDLLVQQLMMDHDADALSDTALALQSLLQAKDTSGLLEIVPLRNHGDGGGDVIHGVLQCQLHDFFRPRDCAATNAVPPIGAELDRLQHSPKRIVVLEASIRLDAASAVEAAPFLVYVTIPDYIRAVQSVATETGIPIAVVDWFLRQITNGSRRIRHSDLAQAWARDPPVASTEGTNAFDFWIRQLQTDYSLLRAASIDHTLYQIWLPTWGQSVVPAPQRAVTDVLVFVKQSQSKERSLHAVVQRLRHSPIPVATVLVPWLVTQGRVVYVERPAGLFVQLV